MSKTQKYNVKQQRPKKFFKRRNRAVASPPNTSFVFVKWHHRTDGLAAICNCMFWLGVRPPDLLFPSGARRWGQGPI